MAPEEKEKEVTVSAPLKPDTSTEKQTQKSTEKALEEERFDVLQFPKKISKYLGMASLVLGVLLLVLFAYTGISGQTNAILLSTEGGSLSFGVWTFVGLFNIIIGFLFLGRE